MIKARPPARSVQGELVTGDATPLPVDNLPPILSGRATPAVVGKVRQFYLSIAEIFERWVARRESQHTQRAYRGDVMDFVRSLVSGGPTRRPPC